MIPTLQVLIEDCEEGTRVLAPAVGLYIETLESGALARGGDVIGRLQVLDRMHDLVLPAEAQGFVQAPARSRRRSPVAYADELFTLEQRGAELEARADRGAGAQSALEGLQVLSPQTGRYYSRPAPDQPSFVGEGDEVHAGQPLGLIEVMKTFTQITYGGAGLPPRARVVKLLVPDEREVRQGEALMLVEEL